MILQWGRYCNWKLCAQTKLYMKIIIMTNVSNSNNILVNYLKIEIQSYARSSQIFSTHRAEDYTPNISQKDLASCVHNLMNSNPNLKKH